MSQLPDLGYEDEPQDHIDIAVTTLAYDNAALVGLLKTRGTHIMNEKWDKMRAVEKEINELKDKEFDDWTRPCSVFMTFQKEEGLQRALEMDSVIKAGNGED